MLCTRIDSYALNCRASAKVEEFFAPCTGASSLFYSLEVFPKYFIYIVSSNIECVAHHAVFGVAASLRAHSTVPLFQMPCQYPLRVSGNLKFRVCAFMPKEISSA